MRRLARWVALCQRDDALANGGRERRNTRRPRPVVQQALDTRLHEPLLPAPQAGLALGRLPHDLVDAQTIGGQQHDPRAPHMFLGAVRSATIASRRARSAAFTSTVIPVRIPQTRM